MFGIRSGVKTLTFYVPLAATDPFFAGGGVRLTEVVAGAGVEPATFRLWA